MIWAPAAAMGVTTSPSCPSAFIRYRPCLVGASLYSRVPTKGRVPDLNIPPNAFSLTELTPPSKLPGVTSAARLLVRS